MVSIDRSGCILVPTEWKLRGRRPFPKGSSLKRLTASTHRRTDSVFVQVFHIGLVPDICWTETDGSDSSVYRHPPHLTGSAGSTMLHLCLYIAMYNSLTSRFHLCTVHLSLVVAAVHCSSR